LRIKPGAQSIIGREFVAKWRLTVTPSWMDERPMRLNPDLRQCHRAAWRGFGRVDDRVVSLILVTSSSRAINRSGVDRISRSNPDKSNYLPAPRAFQLAAELLKLKTWYFLHSHSLQGQNESANAVMAGEVTMTSLDPGPLPADTRAAGSGLSPYIFQRHPSWPAWCRRCGGGIPDIDIVIWTGFLVPAGHNAP